MVIPLQRYGHILCHQFVIRQRRRINRSARRRKTSGARGGKETICDEGGPGGDVSTDSLVSGYTSAVAETQSSRTRLGDINTDDATDDTTGSSGVW